MGLFGDIDIANAADDPFKVDPGTYEAVVAKVEVKPKKDDESKLMMRLDYKITDEESPMVGRQVSEWKTVPTPDDPNNLTADEERAMSFLKSRLGDLGIPESEMNGVEAADLVGINVVITVKQNGEYTNVTKVTTVDNSDTGFDTL